MQTSRQTAKFGSGSATLWLWECGPLLCMVEQHRPLVQSLWTLGPMLGTWQALSEPGGSPSCSHPAQLALEAPHPPGAPLPSSTERSSLLDEYVKCW